MSYQTAMRLVRFDAMVDVSDGGEGAQDGGRWQEGREVRCANRWSASGWMYSDSEAAVRAQERHAFLVMSSRSVTRHAVIFVPIDPSFGITLANRLSHPALWLLK